MPEMTEFKSGFYVNFVKAEVVEVCVVVHKGTRPVHVSWHETYTKAVESALTNAQGRHVFVQDSLERPRYKRVTRLDQVPRDVRALFDQPKR